MGNQMNDEINNKVSKDAPAHFSLAPSLLDEVVRQSYTLGTLYVVATPIGNTCDISLRALYLLGLVDAIACEDTRTSSQLLNRYGINKPLIAAHQHNEHEVAQKIIARLQNGDRIALISDAGTPAVSDPGAIIVNAVREAGLRVSPLPGASAAISALSCSGFVQDQFHFVGFLPSKAGARDKVLQSLLTQTASMIFYEAPHRIADTLTALQAIFGSERRLVLAREISKLFEEIARCNLGEVSAWLKQDAHREKGEYVLVLEGAIEQEEQYDAEAERILKILLEECSVKQAAQLCAQITGLKKNALYTRALQLKNEDET